MNTLIKDIIADTRVTHILEANGFKYVGQLLVISEASLRKMRNGLGKKAINIIASALYTHRYGCIGSRQAHSLPAVVLRHMADLAEAEEEAFFNEHGCTRSEFIGSLDWEDED